MSRNTTPVLTTHHDPTGFTMNITAGQEDGTTPYERLPRHDPNDGRQFILKDCAAEETPLIILEGMRTLGDLRTFVQRKRRVPVPLQQIVVRGRDYNPQHDGSTTIASMLPAATCGYTPIVWLLWLRDDDYYDLDRGWLFHRDDYPSKRELAQRRGWNFRPITLRGYIGRWTYDTRYGTRDTIVRGDDPFDPSDLPSQRHDGE